MHDLPYIKNLIKICFVSSSGGHYEQIKCLKPLLEKYDGFYVTEQTEFENEAKYLLPRTGSNDLFVIFKITIMFIKSVYIWIKERPDYVITNGALICIPFLILSKLFHKKIIYIETFARVNTGSKTGRFMYKHADLFIIQWESLRHLYPNAIYGGSIY